MEFNTNSNENLALLMHVFQYCFVFKVIVNQLNGLCHNFDNGTLIMFKITNQYFSICKSAGS